MGRSGTVVVLMCACLAGGEISAGAASGISGGHALLQVAGAPQRNQAPPAQKNGNRNGQRPPRKMGDWLESHKDLPLDQQEKALENDPNFKRLPPDRQTALKERLRKFNNLSPEQRERALQRLDFLSRLTHEQREQIRDANQKLQGLPPERRVMVHTALRHLRQMDPQQQQQVFQSERFRSTFSEQEQEIVKQLASINPQGAAGPSPSPAGGQEPK